MRGERDSWEYADGIVSGLRHRTERGISQTKKSNSLCKKHKGSRRENSIIPRILPVAPVPWRAGTYVPRDARANVESGKIAETKTRGGGSSSSRSSVVADDEIGVSFVPAGSWPLAKSAGGGDRALFIGHGG
jgi:hypothetical protein